MREFRVFVVAGEASGDVIGGRLIKAMLAIEPNITFVGVGGENMQNSGLYSIFPLSELSVMGISEVIPSYFRLRQRLREAVVSANNLQPDLVITIDSPGFNFRLVRELKKTLPVTTKFVQYVAPSVWAYNPERAKLVAELYDHVLLLLPFESKYFDAVGVANTMVGHPVLEQEAVQPSAEWRLSFSLGNGRKAITVMPGSRRTEVAKHMPIFAEALAKLGDHYTYFVPTLPHLMENITDYADKLPLIPLTDPEDKRQAISASQAALVKSGTSSVEMMAYGVPTVVAYKVNWLTELYIKRHVKIKYASLTNLLLDRPAIPELLMGQCTPENISRALREVLDDPLKRESQLASMAEAMQLLRQGLEDGDNTKPSTRAAKVMLDLLHT